MRKRQILLHSAGDFDTPTSQAHGPCVAWKVHPVIKASVVAPLVILPISALVAISVLFLTGKPKEAGDFLLLYLMYGLPIAYGSLLVVGLPAYFIARWLDAVSYPAAMIAAAVACVIAGSAADRGSFNALASLILFAFGGPIAVVFVRIVRREPMMASLRRLLD